MIVLASPSANALVRWKEALCGFGSVQTISQMGLLRTTLQREKPLVMLLDLALTGPDGCAAVRQLLSLSRATRIIVLSGPISDVIEIALFKMGVRGCCRIETDPQLLKRAVAAIQLGELWIRRSLMLRLVDELGVRTYGEEFSRRAVEGRLVYLTEREREIAALVGSGGSNKQIARQLDISERTVKAHLTEIFRKLGIADRLKLALLLAGSRQAL
jgi:DNA-binding NarL/FixJ family response regulator